MNSIKGLMLKDVLNLKSYMKTILLSMVFFTILFSISGRVEVVGIMNFAVIGMIAVSTFNYDEMAKSDKYILSLPTSKKDIVISKYALVVIFDLIGMVVGFLVALMCKYIIINIEPSRIEKMPSVIGLMINMCGAGFGIFMLQVFQIANAIKFGSEKGRLALFIEFVIIAAVVFAIGFILGQFGVLNMVLDFLESIPDTTCIIASAFIMLIAFIVSYMVSYKSYLKKEI